VHSIVQHTLIQAANEMATYDYVLSLLGFSEINDAVMNRTQGQAASATTLTNNVNTKINEFNNVIALLSSSTDEDGKTVTDQTGQAIKTAADMSAIKSCIVNEDGEVQFKNLFESYIRGALGEVGSAAKTLALGELTRGLFMTYLNDSTASGDTVDILERNLVLNGINGLDFGASKFFDYPNTDTMEISCSYMVKVVSPIPVIEYVPMVNTVKVRAWQDKWSTVTLQSSDSVWCKGLGTNILSAITAHEFNSSNLNMQANGVFIRYDKSSKTATKATAVNFMEAEYADNGKSALQSDLSRIRNFKNQNTTDNVKITASDIKTVKYYVYVPAESAVMATENGKKLTEKKNELAQAQSSGSDTSSISKEISELEKSVNTDKEKLQSKVTAIKSVAKELENNFNSEGNEYKVEIIVKAVDYES
jgi:hypothetical protein